MKTYRRNAFRLIISKELQLRILWMVAGAIFLCVALAGLMFYWQLPILWCGISLLGLGLFISLYVSRLIAGPLYRIEQDLEDWMQGALEGRLIQLRKDDPMQRLAALINKLIERTR